METLDVPALVGSLLVLPVLVSFGIVSLWEFWRKVVR